MMDSDVLSCELAADLSRSTGGVDPHLYKREKI